MISRRQMLYGLGSASAALALYGIPGLSNLKAYAAAPIEISSLESFISMLEIEYGMGNVEWVGETNLVGTEAALFELSKLHGLSWDFSEQVGYREASGCRNNFRAREDELRRTRANLFTDVRRSQIDKDIAILVGGRYQHVGGWSSISGSTQYQSNAAVQLANDDPGVVLAGQQMFDEAYRLISKELALSTAVMSVQPTVARLPDAVLEGTVYSTPSVEITHFPRPVRVGRRTYNKGLIGMQRKRSGDPMKFKGIYV